MEKFTIVITHYNQMNYIEESIKSVLKQNYKNIEVIIADDCSSTFDSKIVEKYIKKYNKNNFEYKIIQGKKNVGTVKNLNNALSKATGDFILFFAADDRLSNKNVVTNFIDEFKDKNKNIVTTQCILYDKDLKEKYYKYVKPKLALKLNSKTSNDIYEKMCEGCFYGSGGTAYRKTIFKKYGKFNEKYKYVEDWAYWVYVLRCGEKMYYADFDTLDHRDGGISHSTYTKETIPPHVRQYYIDILNIYKNEIIPFLDRFTTRQKYRVLKQFNETILYYASFVPELVSYLELFDNSRKIDNKIKYYWKFKTLINYLHVPVIKKIIILFKYNRTVPITAIFWILLCFLLINFVNINISIFYLLSLIGYFILYIFVFIIDRILDYFFKKTKIKYRRK